MKKVALITGSSSDVAKSICEKLNENDIDIVITSYRNHEKSMELYKYLIESSNNAMIVKCDITNECDVSKLINEINNKYNHLDYVINNAALSKDNDIYEKNSEEFLSVLNTNVVGPFLITKYASKIMDDAIIINIASTDGIDTYNIYNMDYSASKSALINLTKSCSRRFDNIKFIALAPNFINTSGVREMNEIFLKNEMHRVNQKKLIEPQEIAEQIYKIINDENIKSGSIIRMDDSNE